MPYVFDALLLAVPLFLILRGFRRGFTRVLLGFVRLAVAALLPISLAPTLAPLLGTAVALPLAYLLLFAAGFVGMTIIGLLLIRFVRASCFSGLDRLLGALSGAATGGLCLWGTSSALTSLLLALGQTDWVNASLLLG